jgi:hypothetical protein
MDGAKVMNVLHAVKRDKVGYKQSWVQTLGPGYKQCARLCTRSVQGSVHTVCKVVYKQCARLCTSSVQGSVHAVCMPCALCFVCAYAPST